MLPEFSAQHFYFKAGCVNSSNTENLDESELIHDYHTFYYPAQRFHFKKDSPREQADLVFENN